MYRFYPLPIIFFAVALTGLSATAAQITYDVVPVTLPDGYRLAGGFITTDGTIGNIDVANITDYWIDVET